MNVYFVGIGGSGIAPLAGIALDCGFSVFGSDLEESLGTKEIMTRGVLVNFLQDGGFLEKIHQEKTIDWVVHTAAAKMEDNLELQVAEKLGIKISKRDEFLNFVLQEKQLKLIAIAGTHGKTTTTSMVVWVLKNLQIPVSYLIGSQIAFGRSSQYQENSQYFVLEADEFDRNFLQYSPYISLVTNIDFDHPDIYKNVNDYYKAFGKFLKKDSNKEIFLWQQDFTKLKNELEANINSFDKDSEIVKNILEKIKLLGSHNRENAFLVYNLLQSLAFDSERILNILSFFPGVCRRMEVIAESIYSDYAHHPTEISATLQSASEIYDNIIVVYQPHQNLRQHMVKENYKNCFDLAKKIYWLPTYLSRESPDVYIISKEELSGYVSDQSKIVLANLDSDLELFLRKDIQKGFTVIFMGAGSIDSWARNKFKKD
jgi:UDP-N-acetylmuramate--alanine ligase